VLAGRPIEVCLTVRNIGNTPEQKVIVSMPVPEGAAIARTTEGGVASGNAVSWELRDLAAGTGRPLCAFFSMRQPGRLSLNATAVGLRAAAVQTACSSTVLGIPAILLELVDVEDPVQVGGQVTYEIKVTNQGSASGTNIRIACTLPASEEFVSGDGVTTVRAQERVVTTDVLLELLPKAAATWRVVVKAVRADDARFRLQLTSDQFQQPIDEQESTELY
jgi:uncharacterized repeat protein (TIGR01451 family)